MGEEDKFLSPTEFKDDSDLSLNEFVLDLIPTVGIDKTKVAEIDINAYDEMTKKIEILSQELKNKDKQWKEKERRLQEERIKSTEEIRRQYENERKEKEKVLKEM